MGPSRVGACHRAALHCRGYPSSPCPLQVAELVESNSELQGELRDVTCLYLQVRLFFIILTAAVTHSYPSPEFISSPPS